MSKPILKRYRIFDSSGRDSFDECAPLDLRQVRAVISFLPEGYYTLVDVKTGKKVKLSLRKKTYTYENRYLPVGRLLDKYTPENIRILKELFPPPKEKQLTDKGWVEFYPDRDKFILR